MLNKKVLIIKGEHKGKSGIITYIGTGWHTGKYTILLDCDNLEVDVDIFEVEPKLCMNCDYFKQGCIQCERGIQMACSDFKDKN